VKKSLCKHGHDTTLVGSLDKYGACKACNAFRVAKYTVTTRGKEAKRKADLKRRGWTPQMYDQTLSEQGGKCMICRQPPTGIGTKGNPAVLAADHSHTTGEPRALLCASCNVLIGHAKESPEICQAAAEYLRAWGE